MTVQTDTGENATPLSFKMAALDICERAFVGVLYAHFVWIMMSRSVGIMSGVTPLIVAAETIPFVFILLRAPSDSLSRHPTDWLFGFLGTAIPLLITLGDVHPLVPIPVSFFLIVMGTYTQIAAKIVLGRRFGIVAANRGVMTAGPYRFLRHPMYAGYTTAHIGFLLAMPTWQNAFLYALAFSMQVVRILREERVLMCDEAYRDFAARVRYRLIPGVF